jgi:predicted DCC family thiol-disulfide oxidoreductase YuxK
MGRQFEQVGSVADGAIANHRPLRPIVLFDGACVICSREMRWMKQRDTLLTRSQVVKPRIAFIDIANAEFDANAWGFDQASLNASLHVRDDLGQWRTGIDGVAFLYRHLGYGWATWPLRFKPLRQVAAKAYRLFAANRYRWFGREAGYCDQQVCANGHCKVD